MSDQVVYIKTVKCFDDNRLTQHFAHVGDAVTYANKLLGEGHQVKLYDYRPPKRRIDYIAEEGR